MWLNFQKLGGIQDPDQYFAGIQIPAYQILFDHFALDFSFFRNLAACHSYLLIKDLKKTFLK